MALSLTAGDATRLEATTRALLSPLAAPDADAWMVEAGERMRDLFGASMFGAAPLTGSGGFRALSPASSFFGRRLEAITEATSDGSLAFRDPLLEAWFAAYGRGASHSTWTSNQRVVEDLGYRMDESLFVSEACRPIGLDDFASLHHHTPAGYAAMLVMGERRGGFRFGDGATDVLRVLSPAFYAGLETVGRFAAHRAALGATLDVLPEPALVLDCDGRERHRNAALGALLAGEPETTAVEHALWQVGRDLRRLAFARRTDAPAPLAPTARTAETARGRYTVRATLLPAGALGPDEAALVTVRADLHPTPPVPAEVSQRTGLTLREAEVALLVADGLTNAAIAERLYVAPGTVKRHVENVLAKLEVPARGGVAARLTAA